MSTWTIEVRTSGAEDQQVGRYIASDEVTHVFGPLLRTLAITPGIKDCWICHLRWSGP